VKPAGAATFTGLVDLAGRDFGGKVLFTSDDFFASASLMLEPGRAVFIEGKYTDRGKWMDGWESRRKRTPGYDHSIIELGGAGTLLGFDIDTSHFSGNQPSFASVEGLSAPRTTTLEALQSATWTELLPQSPLRPDSQNLFAAVAGAPVTHLRLNIFPDGGVARFRAFGRVAPNWTEREVDDLAEEHVAADWIDLAALKNGAVCLACSDAHFGPMNNLLLPGRAADMGGGWETRRRRGPGFDWVLVKLALRGQVRCAEVDTNHFKGNYPDRCALETIDAPGARITDLLESRDFLPLLAEKKLQADTRHFFGPAELTANGRATHVRLAIYPDGGVSRLRLWGTRDG
jgi:allantoicase